jgi:hypothetical protein
MVWITLLSWNGYFAIEIGHYSEFGEQTRCLGPASTVERLKARKGRNRDPLRLKCMQPFMHIWRLAM